MSCLEYDCKKTLAVQEMPDLQAIAQVLTQNVQKMPEGAACHRQQGLLSTQKSYTGL